MKNFRIIRFAVRLSLIVTMMIQPMLAAAVAAGCGDSGCHQSAKMVCEGCGCCEVADPSESCCCCGEAEAAKPKPADCGHESADEPVAIAAATTQVIKGVCLCGLSNPPMNRGSERERASERTELRVFPIALQLPKHGDVLLQQSVPPVFLAATGKIPRFSQRLLCVWRI